MAGSVASGVTSFTDTDEGRYLDGSKHYRYQVMAVSAGGRSQLAEALDGIDSVDAYRSGDGAVVSWDSNTDGTIRVDRSTDGGDTWVTVADDVDAVVGSIVDTGVPATGDADYLVVMNKPLLQGLPNATDGNLESATSRVRGTFYLGTHLFGDGVEVGMDGFLRNWDDQTPVPGGFHSRDFSALLEGSVIVPASGDYTFHVEANGGVRLYVGGERIVDEWNDVADFDPDFNLDGAVNFFDLTTLAAHYGTSGTHADGDANLDGEVNFFDLTALQADYAQVESPHVIDVTVPLVAGQRVPIWVEYFNSQTVASLDLTWTVPGGTEQVPLPLEPLGADPAPTQPGGLFAQTRINPLEVDLTWDDSDNETLYLVYRSTDGLDFSQIAVLPAGTESYTDTLVSPGTHYNYRITAVGYGGRASDGFWVPIDTLPAQPTGVHQLALPGNVVQVNWNDLSDNEDGFHISVSTDGGLTFAPWGIAPPNSTGYIATRLPVNTPVLFSVAAFNSGGESGFGESDGSTTTGTASVGKNFRISLTNPFTTTPAPRQNWTMDNAGHGNSGDLELLDGGWIYADSWEVAALRALSGTYTDIVDGYQYTLGDSGAFSFVDDYVDKFGVHQGRAIRVEDHYAQEDHGDDDRNDAYLAVVVEEAASQAVVYKVEFSASDPAQFKPVWLDGRAEAYESPQWFDTNFNQDVTSIEEKADSRWPVAYLRNSRMKLTTRLVVPGATEIPAWLQNGALVKGTGPDGYDFAAKAAQVVVEGGNVIIKDVDHESVKSFGNKIDFFDDFQIKWEVSVDGGVSWISAGKTSNQIYVIRGAPEPATQGFGLFHTLVHLAAKNAKGLEDDTAAIRAAIWSEFIDLSVWRQAPKGGDEKELTYYGDWRARAANTKGLLRSGDGQCGAWAKFFLDMLRVQGIESANNYATIVANDAINTEFLIKEWSFQPFGSSGDPKYQYLIIPKAIGYRWEEMWLTEVDDGAGLPGQGNEDPKSAFPNHQMASIGGALYDPSYGRKWTSLQEFEDEAIAGYFRWDDSTFSEASLLMDLDGDGNYSTQKLGVRLVRPKDNVLNLKIQPSTY